jgi:iron-sulfur cluster assembly protein
MENEEIQVTESAAEQIKLQLQKQSIPNGYIRLGVKGSGCSGFSYVIRFEDSAPREIDKVFQIHNVNIVIDTKSFLYLKGCTLDWDSSLLKQGFKFINPHEKSQCGCGESFSV